MRSDGISSGWSASTASIAERNRYGVSVYEDEGGWRVRIVDPTGREVSTRACRGETEAQTYASTVRQHIEWLSEETFERYYALGVAEG